jgi:hypothetical protein
VYDWMGPGRMDGTRRTLVYYRAHSSCLLVSIPIELRPSVSPFTMRLSLLCACMVLTYSLLLSRVSASINTSYVDWKLDSSSWQDITVLQPSGLVLVAAQSVDQSPAMLYALDPITGIPVHHAVLQQACWAKPGFMDGVSASFNTYPSNANRAVYICGPEADDDTADGAAYDVVVDALGMSVSPAVNQGNQYYWLPTAAYDVRTNAVYVLCYQDPDDTYMRMFLTQISLSAAPPQLGTPVVLAQYNNLVASPSPTWKTSLFNPFDMPASKYIHILCTSWGSILNPFAHVYLISLCFHYSIHIIQ